MIQRNVFRAKTIPAPLRPDISITSSKSKIKLEVGFLIANPNIFFSKNIFHTSSRLLKLYIDSRIKRTNKVHFTDITDDI